MSCDDHVMRSMSEDAQERQERPYRSHSRPACIPCKRRRSRCKVERGQEICLLCRVHNTEQQCAFPNALSTPRTSSARSRTTPFNSQNSPTVPDQGYVTAPIQQPLPPVPPPPALLAATKPTPPADVNHQDGGGENDQETPVSLDQVEDDNAHIVGPAMADDSHILADLGDYLAGTMESGRGIRLIRTLPGEPSPVIFTSVQKRPLGLQYHASLSSSKCQVIEKLIEPWLDRLPAIYFNKPNICLPLLDEASFMDQYRHNKERISPALLSNLYANTVSYWRGDAELSAHPCPDQRFIWNLANEALYSELNVSPAISTISALLLNVGGRPSTSLIGNGVLLGSAVSLSHSLGLNRNPMSWNIPESEKYLRMKIWWVLLVYDRWSSLAYGTPPHIRRCHHDVPDPQREYLSIPNMDGAGGETNSIRAAGATEVAMALFSLTDVLEVFLERLYVLDGGGGGTRGNNANHQNSSWHSSATVTSGRGSMSSSGKRHARQRGRMPPLPTPRSLETLLNDWVDSLQGDVRRIIIRGSAGGGGGLGIVPGAPNLLLAYLTMKFLLRRIELNACKEKNGGGGSHSNNNRNMSNSHDNTNNTGRGGINNPNLASAASSAGEEEEEEEAYQQERLQRQEEDLSHHYSLARRSAEEIVLFVQDLEELDLRDYWLPVSAFAFTSATAFLLRCALERETSSNWAAAAGNSSSAVGDGDRRRSPAAAAAEGGRWSKNNNNNNISPSLRMANDLIKALRSHRDRFGWDLGELCLTQYEAVVESLVEASYSSVSANPVYPASSSVGSGIPPRGGVAMREQEGDGLRRRRSQMGGAADGGGGSQIRGTNVYNVGGVTESSRDDVPMIFQQQQQFPPQPFMPDPSLIDELFPSIWDTLQGYSV